MAMEYPLGENFSDADPLQGKSNDFTHLRFFSIEENRWYSQRASFIDDKRPSTRTRFCSILMKEEGKNTWQLYLLGGQSTEDPHDGPADIWVLSIPAMMWIQIPNPFDNVRLKSQTCHAVGGSILMMGGYPPSPPGNPDLGCDTRFVRIFDTTQQSWVGNFKANTKYKPPEQISSWARDEPVSGWGSPKLESIFSDITSTVSESVTSTVSESVTSTVSESVTNTVSKSVTSTVSSWETSTSTSPADDPPPIVPSSSPPEEESDKWKKIGFGVGIGVGGGVLALLIFFLWRNIMLE